IAGIEARIAPVKQLWCQQQCHPGAELRALLDQAAQLILQLTAQVQQAEQFAAAHKARLSPELDAASRGRQMQQAYGQVMTNTRMSQSCPIQR
ncbi:MAG TPA: hypothetical protein VFA18_16035, partial [Gemmataceae bacterium]|nr:hypothetical protein [Gemmataceae bacterium]